MQNHADIQPINVFEIGKADFLWGKELKSSILSFLAPHHKSCPHILHGEFTLRGQRVRIDFDTQPECKNSIIWYVEIGQGPTLEQIMCDDRSWNVQVRNYKTFRGVTKFLQDVFMDQ